MSIELLNKAASAAGYAMATPDDDAIVEAHDEAKALVPSRAVVVAEPLPHLGASDAVAGLTTWVKGYWAGFGWRQPA